MTKPNPASFRQIGKHAFTFARVSNPKLRFHADIQCVLCDAPMRVQLGAEHAVFKIGQELVGVVCDGCLDARSQAILRERRMAPADA